MNARNEKSTSKAQPGTAACTEATGLRESTKKYTYLIAALAPASSSFFLIASASAFGMPSLTVEGAPSTRSFASFRPRPVISRMTLMTPTLLAPNSVMVTVNSVCASAAGAAPPAAPPPARGAATATAAAAVTLNFFSMSEISSTTSMTDILEIASRISSLVTAIVVSRKKTKGSFDPNQVNDEVQLGAGAAAPFLASSTAASVLTNLELGAASVPTNFEIGAWMTPSS